MSRQVFKVDRRSFLKTATPFVFCLPSMARGQAGVERGRLSDADIFLAREELFKQLKAERAGAGLGPVQLDDLACRVATEHARDMVDRGFLSHWGSDGRKPYHRYCLAGGTDAVQENASSAENIQSLKPSGVLADLHDMHESMLNEVPPNDGHRKTILFPFHTHVGFGIALRDHNLRLDELYLARYVQIDPFVSKAKPRSSIQLNGRVLNPENHLTEIIVFYEPLPTRPDIAWLRVPRSVSLPEVHKRLRPKAPAGTRYVEGGTGDFDLDLSGKLRVRVKLNKNEPGIYTIVFWLRRMPTDAGFAGAQICILSSP